ncbi:hypothetical protein TNCT_551161 [Trichonephila clavata]|uniref:Uncharacterized protein n=1 Tax=Trichonephila clavata TaxID=2740835 RepID=A0A8X6IMP6_TRICU|nr:hypothetical protein TNCT_551161 [Trichonephila clavata]
MFAKVVIFCAAVAAVSASGIIAPLVNTGISARAQTQDVLGNYAFQYNIKDAATGSINARSEVAAAAPLAYGGVLGHGAALGLGYRAAPLVAAAPLAYGGVLGHGAGLGLGYGAGILGAGIGKLI